MRTKSFVQYRILTTELCISNIVRIHQHQKLYYGERNFFFENCIKYSWIGNEDRMAVNQAKFNLFFLCSILYYIFRRASTSVVVLHCKQCQVDVFPNKPSLTPKGQLIILKQNYNILSCVMILCIEVVLDSAVQLSAHAKKNIVWKYIYF